MFASLLLTMLLAADPVPVAGRPADFSGTIGGPFVVTTTVTPTEVHVGEPITFTLRITGPGDLTQMRRPDLEHNPEFANRFTIEDGADKVIADPPGREFEYTLRARSLDVKAVPRMKFVYFNPAIMPAERGFQTTYANALSVTVTEHRSSSKYEAPRHVRAWVEKNRPPELNYNDILAARDHISWLHWILEVLHLSRRDLDAELPGWMIALAILLPPIACSSWYLTHRPVRASGHESIRIAKERLHGDLTDPPRQVDEVIREFLEAQIDRPLAHATPEEIESELRIARIPEGVVARTVSLLRSAERQRFAPVHVQTDTITQDAKALIRGWELLQ